MMWVIYYDIVYFLYKISMSDCIFFQFYAAHKTCTVHIPSTPMILEVMPRGKGETPHKLAGNWNSRKAGTGTETGKDHHQSK